MSTRWQFKIHLMIHHMIAALLGIIPGGGEVCPKWGGLVRNHHLPAMIKLIAQSLLALKTRSFEKNYITSVKIRSIS